MTVDFGHDESAEHMNAKLLTVTIRGRAVLAKHHKGYGPMAKTYANLTQAQTVAARVGGSAFRFPGSRPFYVWLRSVDAEPAQANGQGEGSTPPITQGESDATATSNGSE